MLFGTSFRNFPSTPIPFASARRSMTLGNLFTRRSYLPPALDMRRTDRGFLIERGFPPEVARFARSHDCWGEDPQATLDDLIVALADEVWKGRRNDHLKSRLIQSLADRSMVSLRRSRRTSMDSSDPSI